MPDGLEFVLAITFSEVVPAAIALYAAYWAFAIRRALPTHFYRRYALWLGALCIIVASAGFITYSPDPIISSAISAYYAIVLAMIFAFVDSVVRVAGSWDPSLVEILHWRWLRIAIWCAIALWCDVEALATIESIPVVGPTIVNDAVLSHLGVKAWVIVAAIVFVPSAYGLLIMARRSRDSALRVSLRWFSAVLLLATLSWFVFALLVSLGVSDYAVFYSYQALPGAVISIPTAYAIYRSVWSLIPVSRLSEAGSGVKPLP